MRKTPGHAVAHPGEKVLVKKTSVIRRHEGLGRAITLTATTIFRPFAVALGTWFPLDNRRAIAVVLAIHERTAANGGVLRISKTGVAVRLVQGAERTREVVQFLRDRLGHSVQSNNHRQDGDCEDQHQLGGDDHAQLVIPKLLQHFKQFLSRNKRDIARKRNVQNVETPYPERSGSSASVFFAIPGETESSRAVQQVLAKHAANPAGLSRYPGRLLAAWVLYSGGRRFRGDPGELRSSSHERFGQAGPPDALSPSSGRELRESFFGNPHTARLLRAIALAAAPGAGLSADAVDMPKRGGRNRNRHVSHWRHAVIAAATRSGCTN